MTMQELTTFPNEDRQQAQGLIITGVKCKSKITDIVSLLEKGISTTQNE